MKSKSEVIPLKFNESDRATSIRAPLGLTEFVDELLDQIEKERGVKISRNSFFLKSIRFYCDYLEKSPNMEEMIKRIYMVDE